MLGVMALAGCGVVLAWTNPSMDDYRDYAGDHP